MDLAVDDNAQALVVRFLRIVTLGYAAVIGIGDRRIPRHALPQTVHVAQVPIGHHVAILRLAAEIFQRFVIIAVAIGIATFLEITGPEWNVDMGQLQLGHSRQVIEKTCTVFARLGGGCSPVDGGQNRQYCTDVQCRRPIATSQKPNLHD